MQDQQRRGRAAPLSPEERRDALIVATVPLLHEHGRAVTTRLIAEAAGVAEGTIFRVFSSKDELVDAAVLKAFEPGRMLADLRRIPLDQPLRDRAVALTRLMQKRFAGVFVLMRKLGMPGPPEPPPDDAERARLIEETQHAMEDLFAPDRADLRMPVADVVRLLRLLTFSGTHPKFTGGDTLTAEQIVDTVLYGAVTRKES
ncbi:TetR/AcrR family transcriptional regulator [Nocardioides sp. MH1]|uniref:TetR/AcrR family transcriptional regulator n=1 Tax=Nocardioides sp. MH1 TaxID=3242490 RepID=UPI0035204BF1